MTPDQLPGAIARALEGLVERGAVPLDRVPGDLVAVEPATAPGRGDYTSSVALRLAGPAGADARALAGLLATELTRGGGLARAEVAGPGFLNLTLAPSAWAEVPRAVLAAGPSYGRVGTRSGTRAVVEAVPVGPAGADAWLTAERCTVLADALGRILDAAGAWRAGDRAGAGCRLELRVQPARLLQHGTVLGPADLAEVAASDAVRAALVRHPAGVPLVLDLDDVTRLHEDNPWFAVCYAHSRATALLRNAADLGLVPSGTASVPGSPAELDLVRAIAGLPGAVDRAARTHEPYRVARHLEEVAESFQAVCATSRVLPRGDEPPGQEHRDRLMLVDATRVVLRNGLALLGLRAPERL